MRIMLPPAPILNGPDNTKKQEAVARLCFDPAEDEWVKPGTPDPHWLTSVHDLAHVRDVLAGRKGNGFNNRQEEFLAHALHSCYAMQEAVDEVLCGSHCADTKPPVVFAPVSGFHHAEYASCGGYCTFNGLMMAAKLALDAYDYTVDSVCIIDGDGHWGNGTQDIIDKLRLKGKVNHVSLDKGSVGGDFKEAQTRIVEALNRRPGLVLYQAGADAHWEDPYGAGYLTDEEWDRRDEAVFAMCNAFNLPLVWNLAGAYNGTKTINLHNRTFVSALREYYPGSYRQTHGLSPELGSSGL